MDLPGAHSFRKSTLDSNRIPVMLADAQISRQREQRQPHRMTDLTGYL